MKNKISIIILMLIMISSFSCSDDILDVTPSDRISVDQVFSTKPSIEALRVGLYNQLGGKGDPNLYQLVLPLLGDILGNDMVYGARWYATYDAEHQYKAIPTGSGVNNVWEKCYYLVEVANTIIEGKSKIAKVFTEAIAAQYVAEAKAIRAMVHYDCAKFYGKAYYLDQGVSLSMPYIDKIDYKALPARNTMKEIYAKAIADLTTAIPNLVDITSDGDRKRMNKNAAYAVLSRIYLDIHDYTKARDNAKLAIKGVGFLSADVYAKGLSHINEETILGFVLHEDNYYKWRSFNTFHDSDDGMGDDFLANYTLYDLIGTDDIRKRFFWHQKVYHKNYLNSSYSIPSGYIKQPKGYYTYGKFPRMDVVYGDSGKEGSLGLGVYSCIRSSEMYLTIAECEAQLGNASEAQENLFKTVSRSIATATKSTQTGEALIDEILIERRKELFGEGHGYRDVLRLGKGLVRDGSQPLQETIPAGSSRFQWPVPERETNANPNLK
jgi:hypothetical protein